MKERWKQIETSLAGEVSAMIVPGGMVVKDWDYGNAAKCVFIPAELHEIKSWAKGDIEYDWEELLK